MVGSPLEAVPTATTALKPAALAPTIKFLCSYGGKIVPRHPDGKLRYLGGHTRVLAVHRSISFPELMSKLGELCGMLVSLRCQLPAEDIDALVSIKSDEDLANLIEEYDRVGPFSPSLKIRAFLSPPPRSATQKVSPPSSDTGVYSPKSLSPKSVSSSSSSTGGSASRLSMPAIMVHRCVHQVPMPVMAPSKSSGKVAALTTTMPKSTSFTTAITGNNTLFLNCRT
ncbi:hypothetical protein Ancab_018911 [Ancistrocladus abbreviatus]